MQGPGYLANAFIGAAERGHLTIVKWFVEVLGVSTEHTSPYATAPDGSVKRGLTPFAAALGAGHLAVARYLFTWGYDTHTGYQLWPPGTAALPTTTTPAAVTALASSSSTGAYYR